MTAYSPAYNKPLSTEERIGPFLALLEARYLPLLLAVAHQAYTMHLWLWHGSDQSYPALFFSIVGALGYESIYVGAIAWTVEGRTSPWTWITSTAALIFSVAVAVYVYWDTQGYAALLHAGFPIVGFCYTMALHHIQAQAAAMPGTAPAPTVETPAPLPLPTPAPAPAPLPEPAPDIDFSPAPVDEPKLTPEPEPLEFKSTAKAIPVGGDDSNIITLPEWLVGEGEEEVAKESQEEEETPTIGLSLRAQVYAILAKRGNLKDGELYALLPGKSQSSIRVNASDWRNGVPLKKKKAVAPNGNHQHA